MIKVLLLEHFWVLFGIGLIVSAGTFFLAMQRRTRLWLMGVKIVPVVFAVLLAINYFVVTQREAIGSQLDKLLNACEMGNIDAIAALLDDDVTASGMNKTELVEQVREVFGRMDLDILRSSAENNPPSRVTKITALTQIRSKSGTSYGAVPSQWTITFRKPEKEWLIWEIQPISLQGRPVNDIRDVLKKSHQVQ